MPPAVPHKKTETICSVQTHKSKAKSGVSKYGTDIALISSVECENKARRKPRSPAVSTNLSLADARRLVESLLWAEGRWLFWRSLTINFDLLNSPTDRKSMMMAIRDYIYHWQKTRNAPPFYCAVHECGGFLGAHCHFLIAIPEGQGRALSDAMKRWLRGPLIRADMIKHTLESRNTAVQGYLLYVLKTLTPEDAKRLTQETGLRFSTVKPEASVLGRRINIARAMQQAARGRASL